MEYINYILNKERGNTEFRNTPLFNEIAEEIHEL